MQSDRISIQNNVAKLQFIENSSISGQIMEVLLYLYIQSNFYKLNYPEKNFNLQKLQVKKVKSDRKMLLLSFNL